MTDIVKRLRNAKRWNWDGREAADTIERLRTVLGQVSQCDPCEFGEIARAAETEYNSSDAMDAVDFALKDLPRAAPDRDDTRLDIRLIETIHGWLDTWEIELKDNEPFYDLLWRIKSALQRTPQSDGPTPRPTGQTVE